MKFLLILLPMTLATTSAAWGAAPTHRLDLELCHAPSAAQMDTMAPLISSHVDEIRPYLNICPGVDGNGRVVIRFLVVRLDMMESDGHSYDSRGYSSSHRRPGPMSPELDPYPTSVILSSDGQAIGRLGSGIFNEDEGPDSVTLADWRDNFPHRIEVWERGEIGVIGPGCELPLVWDAVQMKFAVPPQPIYNRCQ